LFAAHKIFAPFFVFAAFITASGAGPVLTAHAAG